MDYPKLQGELATDPMVLGYAGKTDQQAADLLNSLTTGRTLMRQSVSQYEFANAIGNVDFPTLVLNQSKFQFLYSQASINPNNAQMVAMIQAVFPTTTPTWTRLVALAQPTVSRATELALGATPTAVDVNRARAGVW
ncbi:MAG: hypothetical protein NVSMB60_08040 [Mycobacterium sp.]